MFGNAILRTYCYETEDENKVEKALNFISKAKITKINAEGFHGNKIIIMESKLNKKQSKELFERIKKVREEIDLENKIDDDCNFYLRFDKQSAFKEKLVLSIKNDVISLKAKILTFPQNRKNAIKQLKEFLS